MRTGLLALHTAYTTVGAVFACECAFVVIGTFYSYAYGISYKMNKSVGTLSCAYAASDTLLWINACNTVFYRYRILRTDLCAIAVSKTSKVTELVTLIGHIRCETCFLSAIVVFFLHGSARAVAGNVCYLFDNVCSFNAKDGSN